MRPETADHLILRVLTFVGDLQVMAHAMLHDGAAHDDVIATIWQTVDDFQPTLLRELVALEQPSVVE